MDDLALEVRLVDDVRVDDPEPADARGGEVHGHRRPEPPAPTRSTRASSEPLLPVLADLGDEGMAAVARALLGGEDARDRDVEAVLLPVGEAAREVDDVEAGGHPSAFAANAEREPAEQ